MTTPVSASSAQQNSQRQSSGTKCSRSVKTGEPGHVYLHAGGRKYVKKLSKMHVQVRKKQNVQNPTPVIVDWLATVSTDVIVPSPVHFPNNLKSYPLKFVLKHFINSSHIIYRYTSEWQFQECFWLFPTNFIWLGTTL